MYPAARCRPRKGGRWSDTPEMNGERRALLQMLFVEGNHFCPSCEKSGDCQLQALAYDLEMLTPRFDHFFPDRPVDASHPEVLLDFNRCIYCELCVRASRDKDGKSVFALTNRGIHKHLVVNAESGRLADTDFAADDMAANICPVGVILHKRVGFAVAIGERTSTTGPRSTRWRCARRRRAMIEQRKLRVATVSLAGCFGCHMSFWTSTNTSSSCSSGSSSTARR